MAGGGRLSASAYVNDEGFELPRSLQAGSADCGWGLRAVSVSFRQALGAGILAESCIAVSQFSGTLTSFSAGGAELPVLRTGMRSAVASLELTRHGRSHRLALEAGAEAVRLSHQVRPGGTGTLEPYLPVLGGRTAGHRVAPR